MPTVTLRESAKLDLIEHFVYLAEHAGEDVADRFLTNAEASFNDLAMQPQIGARLKLKNPALEKLGAFKADELAVEKWAPNTTTAQKVFDRAGWR